MRGGSTSRPPQRENEDRGGSANSRGQIPLILFLFLFFAL
jgi:hypothetical protein